MVSSPAISIDQKTTNRSTVGTTTEINDYLRLLYARVGTPLRINGHGAIEASSVERVNKVLVPNITRIPSSRDSVRKRAAQDADRKDSKDGYVRVRVDGVVYDVTKFLNLKGINNTTLTWW